MYMYKLFEKYGTTVTLTPPPPDFILWESLKAHRRILLKSEIFVTLGRELQTAVLLPIPNVEPNEHKHDKAAECRGEHTDHIIKRKLNSVA
jgi:hypothetical protein